MCSKTSSSSPLSLAKAAAGKAAAQLIESGMIVGLGTGSTAAFFIENLGQRCRSGELQIHAVASSEQSVKLAQSCGIPLIAASEITRVDLTVDGADEVDPQKRLIKGGGGALLREKILASSSREMIVILDETKLVDQLGLFPLPIEISPFAYQTTLARLAEYGYRGHLRLTSSQQPFLTDNQHYIVDIALREYSAPLPPEQHDQQLKRIPGVLETGFFIGIAGRLVIGYVNGEVKICV